MKKKLSIELWLSLVLILFISQIARAQNKSESPNRVSDAPARTVLKKALDKLGGIERIRAIGSVMIQTEGFEYRSAEIQGYQPDKETKAKHSETIVVYPSQAKFVYEHRTGRHDGSERWRRQIMNGENLVRADFISNRAFSVNNRAIPLLSKEFVRRIPHMLLLEVSDSKELLLLGETADYEGRKHEVIAYRIPNSEISLRLFIDKDSHLLSKYEYDIDYSGLGLVKIEYCMEGYKEHPKLGWFPSGDKIKLDGRVFREVDFKEVLVGSPGAEAMFMLPPHLAEFIAPPGSTLEVAKGVFITQVGPYYPMFIEFEDFVLAVEAPADYLSLEQTPAGPRSGNDRLSVEFLRKIKEKIPNKPVKYLVTTHFHGDHAGGARVFVENGTTILTTPGNRQFFERMAAATTLSTDAKKTTPKIEVFTGKKTISDSTRTVDLIDVGANPHTAENTIIWIRKEKILFQGDLFYFFGDISFPPRSETTVMPFFSKWLIKNGIRPSRIYGFHGRGFATMRHVEEILARSK